MKLMNEDLLLNKEYRVKVIKHLGSNENKARKAEAMKRYEVLKDNTAKYVMLKLKREIKREETLQLMENRASNISIAKKIVKKLARVYADSVKRSTGAEATDMQVTELAKMMNFNSQQKKVDRYTRMFKNSMPWIYPDLAEDGKYRLCMKVFAPWQYDVLESANEPEEAACVVLSDFADSQFINLGTGPLVTQLEATAAVQQSAAGAKDAETFIFWSKKYHFTCNNKGDIIQALSPEGLLNPINAIPGVTAAEDQDGGYWATGGEDLADGAILINTLITDMNSILFMQGWGQLVITGTHVPEEFQVGPHRALVLRYDPAKDEAQPQVTTVSSNPPVDAWMKAIEQYVALLLSTNNLSPRTISAKLSVSDFPSGIAMLIDQSESTESIEDKQTEFYWIEMKEWEIIKRWHNLYFDRGLLSRDFQAIGRLPDDLMVTPKFQPKTAEVVTEADRLKNLQLRKNMGLATQLDLIMADNPGMTREEAEAKLLEIAKDKAESASKEMAGVINDGANGGGHQDSGTASQVQNLNS